MRYIGIALLCIGCGAEADWMRVPTGGTYIPAIQYDPELVQYLQEFRADAAAHGVAVNPAQLRRMTFEQLEYPNVGICTQHYSGEIVIWSEIRIDPDVTCLARKRGLLYHEFGHCLLGLPHRDDGIMRGELYSCEYFAGNWTQLLEELFE